MTLSSSTRRVLEARDELLVELDQSLGVVVTDPALDGRAVGGYEREEREAGRLERSRHERHEPLGDLGCADDNGPSLDSGLGSPHGRQSLTDDRQHALSVPATTDEVFPAHHLRTSHYRNQVHLGGLERTSIERLGS
jgi:hypothetical protein